MQKMIDFIESLPQEDRDRMAGEVEAKLAAMTEEERDELMMDVFFGKGPEAESIKRKLRDLSGVDPKDYRPEIVRSLDIELENLMRRNNGPERLSSAEKTSLSFEKFVDKMYDDQIFGKKPKKRFDV